jgi:hypothetical protein
VPAIQLCNFRFALRFLSLSLLLIALACPAAWAADDASSPDCPAAAPKSARPNANAAIASSGASANLVAPAPPAKTSAAAPSTAPSASAAPGISAGCADAPPATETVTTTSAPKAAGQLSANPPDTFLSEHFHFQALDAMLHYRYADKGVNKVTSRDLWDKISVRAQVNLDTRGNSYFAARAETGTAYQLSYNYTGLGLHNALWRFNIKTFYYGQKFARDFEAQAGALELDWGLGTEATYSDNDGYFEGYRLRYTPGSAGSSVWMPDKLDVTAGYLGDFTNLNAFSRMYRLGQNNYWQVLAQKKLTERVEASASYESLQSVRYERDAVHIRKVPAYIVDDVLLENIVRANDNPSFGWSATLNKNLDPSGRFRLGAFYVDMPQYILSLDGKVILYNGDAFGTGEHIGPVFSWLAFKDCDFTAAGWARVGNTSGIRYRGNLQIRYHFAGLFNRALR